MMFSDDARDASAAVRPHALPVRAAGVAACLLASAIASDVRAGEFDGRWIGVGETMSSDGGWICTPKFGFRFQIDGGRVSGNLRGTVDANGHLEAEVERTRSPFYVEGQLQGATASGEWRIVGRCRGMWRAKRQDEPFDWGPARQQQPDQRRLHVIPARHPLASCADGSNADSRLARH